MPMRKRRHMAVFKGVMMAHAPVLTEATTSGGWMGWMTAKMSPATKAAKPLQRMRLDAVTFISLFSFRRLLSGHLRSRVCLLPPVQQESTVTSAEARDFFSACRIPSDSSPTAIRTLSERRWIEAPHDRPYAEQQLPEELRDDTYLPHTPFLEDP